LAEQSQRHGAADWNQPELGNSLFRQMNSLFGQKNSLLSEEQGIGGKLLNPLGHLLQNGPERPESCESFKNSLLFSLFSGNGVEASRRQTVDIKHILFFDVTH
jgi:hypothetical protein